MSNRLMALVLAGMFLTSAASAAWAHCIGGALSVADAHACCRSGAMATETRATACCAMSDQSGDRGPIEARVTSGALKAVRHDAPPVALAIPACASALHAPIVTHTSGSVPLYLRQVSLLI
jgi:hypothetical protein